MVLAALIFFIVAIRPCREYGAFVKAEMDSCGLAQVVKVYYISPATAMLHSAPQISSTGDFQEMCDAFVKMVMETFGWAQKAAAWFDSELSDFGILVQIKACQRNQSCV